MNKRINAVAALSAILIGALLAAAGIEVRAAGDAEAGRQKSQTCIACHGPEGISAILEYPNLAGQVPGYITDALRKFKSGERQNPLMTGMVAPLSEQDIADLDAYYSNLPPYKGTVAENDEALARAGEGIYRGGEPKLSIAACMSCHGPSGHGIPPHFPRVAGQRREYLKVQLLALKSGERKSEIMNPIAFRLSLQQIEELSAYMQGLR